MNSNPINEIQDLVRKLLIYFKNKRFNEGEKLAIFITQKFPTIPFSWKALWAALKKKMIKIKNFYLLSGNPSSYILKSITT